MPSWSATATTAYRSEAPLSSQFPSASSYFVSAEVSVISWPRAFPWFHDAFPQRTAVSWRRWPCAEPLLIARFQYREPKNPYDFSGKKTIVVGIGNSGADIATELSRAGQVYLATRSGAWILPKFCPYHLCHFSCFSLTLVAVLGFAMDHLAYNRILLVLLPLRAVIRISAAILQLVTTVVQGLPKGWNLDPGVGVFSAHLTMQPELLGRVGTGTVVVKPNIKSFEKDGHTVRFTDGSFVDGVDAVVFCTGYSIKARHQLL